MVATAIYSVTMVLWKETAFPLCRAMERRWKRNYYYYYYYYLCEVGGHQLTGLGDASSPQELVEVGRDVDETGHTQRQTEHDVGGLRDSVTLVAVVEPRHQRARDRQHDADVVQPDDNRSYVCSIVYFLLFVPLLDSRLLTLFRDGLRPNWA